MKSLTIKVAVVAIAAGMIVGGLGLAQAQVSDRYNAPVPPTTVAPAQVAGVVETAPSQTG